MKNVGLPYEAGYRIHVERWRRKEAAEVDEEVLVRELEGGERGAPKPFCFPRSRCTFRLTLPYPHTHLSCASIVQGVRVYDGGWVGDEEQELQGASSPQVCATCLFGHVWPKLTFASRDCSSSLRTYFLSSHHPWASLFRPFSLVRSISADPVVPSTFLLC